MMMLRDGVVRASAGLVGLAVLVGSALGEDRSDAATRLAEARAAYEAALAELRAAEAAAAADGVAQAEPAPDVEGAAAATAGAGVVAAQPDASAPALPGEERTGGGFFDWDAWEKSIDIGITGASGNTENLSLRLDVGAARNTPETETKLAALYRMSSEDGNTTENRFRFDVFNDWLPPEGSRIRWWAKGAYEFDDFQAWDHRVSASAGVGYEIVKNDKHVLVGRLGLGGSQTFGDQEDFRPEAVAGLDYTYQIKQNQKLTAGTEFLLDVSDVDFWRSNSYLRYEAVIDPESGMNFKTGVTHRYDSRPGDDVEKSDLEYFATLGWKF